MAYVQLALSNSLPDSVRTVIQMGVEPFLRDVHWMLATHIGESTESGPGRQLQFPIALMLLSTVAGVSEKLLHVPEKCRSGQRFKKCLKSYFPWDIDPPTGASPECAAMILYEFFRNPLTHRLGFHTDSDPAIRINQPFPGTDDAERRVEDLERLETKPASEPCLVVTPQATTLWLGPFYWGVRKLVERWSYDDIQVSEAENSRTRRVKESGGRLGAEKITNGP